MAAVHLPPTASPEEVAATLREHGHAIIDDLAPLSLMNRLRDEVDPYVEMSQFDGDDASGKHMKRTGRLLARAPASRELVLTPLLVNGIRSFLSKTTSMQLSAVQILSLWPGNTPQPLHRDEGAWDMFPWPLDYDVQVNVLWALTEFTEEMGATRIVPGSHRLPVHSPDPSNTFPAEMSRGSALLLSGKIYHGTGPNRSTRVRQAVDVNYTIGWVRQNENQYLSTPLEIAKTLPPELIRLMGYEMGGLGIGYVGDYEDPMSVIDPTRAISPSALQQARAASASRIMEQQARLNGPARSATDPSR